MLAIAGLAVFGMVGFATTIGTDQESTERFAKILAPGEDYSFQQRLAKWDLTLDGINKHPLGEGLGTTGDTQRIYSHTYRVDNVYIDNSLLQLGVQQGYPGWILFGLSVVLIGYTLVRSSLGAQDRRMSTLGIGAVAALASWMVILFGTGDMFSFWVAPLLWVLLGLGVGACATSTPSRTGGESG